MKIDIHKTKVDKQSDRLWLLIAYIVHLIDGLIYVCSLTYLSSDFYSQWLFREGWDEKEKKK